MLFKKSQTILFSRTVAYPEREAFLNIALACIYQVTQISLLPVQKEKELE